MTGAVRRQGTLGPARFFEGRGDGRWRTLAQLLGLWGVRVPPALSSLRGVTSAGFVLCAGSDCAALPMGASWRKAEVPGWLSAACMRAGLGRSPFASSGALAVGGPRPSVSSPAGAPAGMNSIQPAALGLAESIPIAQTGRRSIRLRPESKLNSTEFPSHDSFLANENKKY